jgi:glyceraldehyde-3-phosphate dehydrogenase/erythrose-4-phosphate dehydrogenase
MLMKFGFGKMYALGINDAAITKKDQFIHVVSCNTHNMAVLFIHSQSRRKKVFKRGTISLHPTGK